MTSTKNPSGAELIAVERRRQVDEEGYDPAHDRGHAPDLIAAGVGYAQAGACEVEGSWYPSWVANDPDDPAIDWPWHPSFWKPTGDAVRDLVKAGALIAAAIDSILQARADTVAPVRDWDRVHNRPADIYTPPEDRVVRPTTVEGGES